MVSLFVFLLSFFVCVNYIFLTKYFLYFADEANTLTPTLFAPLINLNYLFLCQIYKLVKCDCIVYNFPW